MVGTVAASNYLVQFPINSWLTYGALTYPASFLITELTNRSFGPSIARRVVYAGFVVAVVISVVLSTPKIACASGSAFLIAQLLDISVFNRLRQSTWWKAPLIASACASAVDTAIFFSLAFWGEPLPVLTLALGDFGVKLLLDVLMLSPFRFFTRFLFVRGSCGNA